jgi:large conductance mechanosensitive channel
MPDPEPQKKTIVTEFKEFILRGNVVDLAVAVVMGAAFGAVVNSLVKDLFTPLVAAVIGKPDFGNLSITIHHSAFRYGNFINALITFVTVAVAMFFFVVKPLNWLIDRTKRGELDPDSEDRPCPQCLSPIPKAARRCAFCTSEVAPSA